ncbi:hypothetical protein ADUPG1_004554, partial [Aduncisulcus paluster]
MSKYQPYPLLKTVPSEAGQKVSLGFALLHLWHKP